MIGTVHQYLILLWVFPVLGLTVLCDPEYTYSSLGSVVLVYLKEINTEGNA